MSSLKSSALDVRVHGCVPRECLQIVSPDALRFIGYLHSRFEQRRQVLLSAREVRQSEFDAGLRPEFLPETAHIRNDPSWKVRPAPADLLDRRVEITGPVDRKMVINGLNSGASTYMADFEDSTSPTWINMLEGQVNLHDACLGTIEYTNPDNKKVYRLGEKQATLLVRPRGWHLNENHVTVNGEVVSGAIFDFALYFFHNHVPLAKKGSGPYFYLAKMENHLEARLWADVMDAAEDYVGAPRGTARGTALLETITAAFEMEEMLYELREHSTGLNCGRWDYIFSYIKKFRCSPDFITNDRKWLTMQAPFMQAYVKLLIHTCHKRGAHAMGGMAAQIPVKNNPEEQEKAMASVRADKLREVTAGHDGTWVAHPALVGIAMDIFNEHMPGPNQLDKVPPCSITAADLLERPTEGSITTAGLVENVDICLEYVGSWVKGVGCIPMHNKMEDAATAEISRVQVWHWANFEVSTTDGTVVTRQLVKEVIARQGKKFQAGAQKSGDYAALRGFMIATKLVSDMMTRETLDEFLTSVAYPHLVTASASRL